MFNNLVLRILNSPYGDMTLGSVLAWEHVDNNFIFLKGGLIKSGMTQNNNLYLQSFNGEVITIPLNLTGSTSGGTGSVTLSSVTFDKNYLYIVDTTGGTFTTLIDYFSGLTVSGSVRNGNNVSANGNYSHAEGGNTTATGDYSHAEGLQTSAGSNASHAEGVNTTTTGDYSHAEGFGTFATAIGSHAEGLSTLTSGIASHTEGSGTTASGDYSHAEGLDTLTNNIGSHAEGYLSTAQGIASHAEGENNYASGDYSHAEGSGSTSQGNYSHAEGITNVSLGLGSHAEGTGTLTNSDYSHAEGTGTTTNGIVSHAEGISTVTYGDYSHAEGENCVTIGLASHAEGSGAQSSGNWSHAEGINTQANASYSHTEGQASVSNGLYSHAEGSVTNASGLASHAEGTGTLTIGQWSHAEGNFSITIGDYSHAEGSGSTSVGAASHAEGSGTTASGIGSHSEGAYTQANGIGSHAEGLGTIAAGNYQSVIGQYNTTGNTSSIFVIGNGTSNSSRSDLVLFYPTGITFNQPVYLPAGTSAANTAPLRFTSGSTNTIPQNGAIEYDGIHFYGTVGSTRYQLDQQAKNSITGSTFGSGNTLTLRNASGGTLSTIINNFQQIRITGESTNSIGDLVGLTTYGRPSTIASGQYGYSLQEYSFVTANSGFRGYLGVQSWGYVTGGDGATHNKFTNGYISAFSSGQIWDGSLGGAPKTVGNIMSYFSSLNSQAGFVTNAYDVYTSELNSIGATTQPPTGVTNHYALYSEPFTRATNNYGIYINGPQSNYFGGRVGIGVPTPLGLLHLSASTTTIPPIILSSGVTTTSPVPGSIEYDGIHFYGTVGSTRYQLDQQSAVTPTLEVVSTAGSTFTTPHTFVAGNNIQTFTSTQTGTSNTAWSFQNTGNGVGLGVTNTGTGAALSAANSGSGNGLLATSVSGIGVNATSNSNTAARFKIFPTGTTSTDRVINIIRGITGVAANGSAGSIGLQLTDDSGSDYAATTITWAQTNASSTARTSTLAFTTNNTGSSATKLFISGPGQMRFNTYGVNSFTGTPATNLLVDSSGNVIEGSLGPVVNNKTTTYSILTNESTKCFTNEGAAGTVRFNLPNATPNLKYSFIIRSSNNFQISAATGNNISIAGSINTSNSISASTTATTVTLLAINTTDWVATSVIGTWS